MSMTMVIPKFRTLWASGRLGLWLVAAVACVSASPCLARSITIEDFSVAIQVDESSTLEVTETIRIA